MKEYIALKILLFANSDWYLYNFRRSLVAALKDAGHDVLLVSPPGRYGEKLRAWGFRWTSAPMRRESLNLFRELALLFWLWRLSWAEKPQLIHGFTTKCAVYGGIAARLAGFGRVNSVTGMGYVFISDAPKARLLRPVVRALMRFALNGERARLILQNPDDVRLFEQMGITSRAKIHLIPGSGVDCTRFLPPLR